MERKSDSMVGREYKVDFSQGEMQWVEKTALTDSEQPIRPDRYPPKPRPAQTELICGRKCVLK